MAPKRWLQEQEIPWKRLEVLLSRSDSSLGSVSLNRLSPDEIREMALLYRNVVNDLSRSRSLPEFHHLEPYLNNLVQRCHGKVYERPPSSWQDVANFFLRDFPACFRKHSVLIGLAFLLFLLGTTVAMLTVHFDPNTESYFLPSPVVAQLDKGVLWTDHLDANPSESSFLMTNNIRVAINAFALGILFGIGSLLLMFQNGLSAFGGPLAVCFQHGMGFRLLTFVTAHGVIELTTIFIAGGAGMLIGFTLLFPGDLPRWQAVRMQSKDSLILIMGCFPLLVIAGLIEGLVSLNRHVGPEIRIAMALLSFCFLVGYLGFSGRSKSTTE